MKTLISSQGLGTYVSLVLFCGNFWNQPVHKKKKQLMAKLCRQYLYSESSIKWTPSRPSQVSV